MVIRLKISEKIMGNRGSKSPLWQEVYHLLYTSFISVKEQRVDGSSAINR